MNRSSVILSDLSDHLPIVASLKNEVPNQLKNQQPHTVFDFRKIDLIRERIPNRLNGFFEIYDAELSCDTLLDVLREEILAHSIKKPNRQTVPIQPWISYDLLRRINRKNELHRNVILSPTEENHNTYKAYRNNLTTSIREAKKGIFWEKIRRKFL